MKAYHGVFNTIGNAFVSKVMDTQRSARALRDDNLPASITMNGQIYHEAACEPTCSTITRNLYRRSGTA